MYMKKINQFFKSSNGRIIISFLIILGIINMGYILAGVSWKDMLTIWGGVTGFAFVVILLVAWISRGE